MCDIISLCSSHNVKRPHRTTSKLIVLHIQIFTFLDFTQEDKIIGFCRLCFRLRTALLCWFSLSFTTCFGLHGHLQVCRKFYIHLLEGFCFPDFFLPFFSHCTFPSVGWVKYEVLLFMLFLVLLYVFLYLLCLSCSVFLR
jgi:hypothetical protein